MPINAHKPISRNIGIDLTRIIAFICVPAVHFFLHTGFYGRKVNCPRMYCMVSMRTAFMVCVPLFLIITGYLMSEKSIEITKKSVLSFYGKLSKVLSIYCLSTIVVLITLTIYQGSQLTLKDVVFGLLSYHTGYSWYVEMYIGLFLLIPFLNALWNQCEREGRRIIVVVFVLLTVLFSVLNVYDLSSLKTFLYPWMAESFTKIVPAWWDGLYPITYYFIGAYIRRDVNVKKLNSKVLAGLLLLSIILFSSYNIWRSYSIPFVDGNWAYWGGIENVTDATLLFLLINSINYEKVSESAGKTIGKIANVTFAAYLLSVVPDTIIYGQLKENVPQVTKMLNYFPITVLTVIIASLLMGFAVNIIYKYLKKIIGYKQRTEARIS